MCYSIPRGTTVDSGHFPKPCPSYVQSPTDSSFRRTNTIDLHVTRTAGHTASCAALPNREGQFRTLCLVEVDIGLENPLNCYDCVNFGIASLPSSDHSQLHGTANTHNHLPAAPPWLRSR